MSDKPARTSIEKAEHGSWVRFTIAAVAIVGLAIAVLAGIIAQVQHDDDLAKIKAANAQTHALALRDAARQQCIQDYVARSFARSTFIQRYAIPRNNALADLIRVASRQPQNAAEIKRLDEIFLRVDKAYRRAIEHNPIPAPPKLRCGGAKPPVLHAPSSQGPTRTRTATVTPTAPTATRTATQSAPGPTVTATRTVAALGPPQPPVTRFRTRTATETATVTETVSRPLVCVSLPLLDC